LNSYLLVGKVLSQPVLKETSGGIRYAPLLLEVKKEFKNASGNFDSDVYQIMLWKNQAEEAVERAMVDSLVCVKGRIQASNYAKDGEVYYHGDLVGERVEYLN